MLLYGKYLDDIDWVTEIRYYIQEIKKCGIDDIKCLNIGELDYNVNDIKVRKRYVIDTAGYKECIIMSKNYFQWWVTDRLTKSSPHMKKLFKLIFYPLSIHPYNFYIDPEQIYDYEYINYICECIEDAADKLLTNCV
jgi:hypothetical protein